MIDLTQYEQRLGSILRDIIINKGLVDSGALLDSAEVKIELTPFTIEVISEDYLKFLEQDYRVVNDFAESFETQQVIEELLKELIENTEDDASE